MTVQSKVDYSIIKNAIIIIIIIIILYNHNYMYMYVRST